MNPAPAHLEDKLRPIWEFTVWQIAGLFCGALIGVVWAKFLCPVDGVVAAVSGVYIAALPSLPVFLASQTDFDLWLVVRGAFGWRAARGPLRPRGRREPCRGYRTEEPETVSGEGWVADLNLQALWEEGNEHDEQERAPRGPARREASRRERAARRARSAVSGRERLPQAGELLAVEAIDRSGLVVTGEGAFVRIFRVVPPNPLLMSDEERAQTAATFERMIGQLQAEETLQIYIDARPVNQAELLADCRAQVRASAGPPPTRERSAGDAMSLSQWRLYAALEESIVVHTDERSRPRCTSPAYVVVPWTPRQGTAAAALAWARKARPGSSGLQSAPLERPVLAHRRAVREHLAHVDSLRAELEAEGMSTELLCGEQVFAAAAGALQSDPGRPRPGRAAERRGARRSRRARRARDRARGGDPAARADRAVVA